MSPLPGFQPLYRQVYDVLVRRIADGDWKPGESLPNEQVLAQELGVSHGTVRKALDALAAENLINRRQGKGTFVAEHTREQALFRFFRLAHPDGEKAVPESDDERVRRRTATGRECEKLKLKSKAQVVEICRTRLINHVPATREKIVIPLSLFPGIDSRGSLPNTLYSLYQREYGVNVVLAEEEVSADVANRDDAAALPLDVGSPVLQIDRVAICLDGKPVERRISRCDTRNIVYAVRLN